MGAGFLQILPESEVLLRAMETSWSQPQLCLSRKPMCRNSTVTGGRARRPCWDMVTGRVTCCWSPWLMLLRCIGDRCLLSCLESGLLWPDGASLVFADIAAPPPCWCRLPVPRALLLTPKGSLQCRCLLVSGRMLSRSASILCSCLFCCCECSLH